jgi:hypothetical protein
VRLRCEHLILVATAARATAMRSIVTGSVTPTLTLNCGKCVAMRMHAPMMDSSFRVFEFGDCMSDCVVVTDQHGVSRACHSSVNAVRIGRR